MFYYLSHQRNYLESLSIPIKTTLIKETNDKKRWRWCASRGAPIHWWWECELVDLLWTPIHCWWECELVDSLWTLIHCWWECGLIVPLWKPVWSILKNSQKSKKQKCLKHQICHCLESTQRSTHPAMEILVNLCFLLIRNKMHLDIHQLIYG